MTTLYTALSMSLDGFIAGPHDDVSRLHSWLFSSDTPVKLGNTDMEFYTSRTTAELLQALYGRAGAEISGRRTFDLAGAWGGNAPLGIPCFVLSHTIPDEWAGADSPFTFVTDGIESVVAQAKAAAGNKDVSVAAASLVQQCLNAKLLDEIHISLVPVLLGDGVRFFEHLKEVPIELECTRVVEDEGITHLSYKVHYQ